VAIAAGLVVAASRSAATEPTATERTMAQSLFDDARTLYAAGEFSDACDRFQASQRLDPRLGTLMNMAMCHEKIGRTASAWAEFKDAALQAARERRPDREKFARERVEALAPILSRLKIIVPPNASLPGLALRLDGVLLDSASSGFALPVDPGPHKLEATAPDRDRWETRFEVGQQADLREIAVPVLSATVEPTPSQPVRGDPPPAVSSTAPAAAPSSARTRAGLLVGATGMVGVAVGSVFGLRALSKRNDAEELCSQGDCGERAHRLNDEGITAAWISNVGFGLGLVGIGVGSWLLLTSGAPEQETRSAVGQSGHFACHPIIESTEAGLGIRGTW
jgi:hypothetical protein